MSGTPNANTDEALIKASVYIEECIKRLPYASREIIILSVQTSAGISGVDFRLIRSVLLLKYL